MSTAETCPACGAESVVNGVCGRCGYASGESNRCPHCGAVARVEARGTGALLAWVCAVCGGPRIPGGFGGVSATRTLKEAKAFLSAATRAKATAIGWGVLALLGTLVVIAATAKEAILATLVLAALAVVPAILALRARSRGEASKKAADEAEGNAWQAAAEDVARRAPDGITAEELANKLQIDVKRADRLLSELAVHERTRIDVGDDAEVRYSVTPQLRVGGQDPLLGEEGGDDADEAAKAEATEEAEKAAKLPGGAR
jgi:hypothetical protein